MNKILELDRIKSGYGKRVVLEDISFFVQKGEFIGIIGPNGCGKSTLLKTISGVIKPFEGKITIDSRDSGAFSIKDTAKLIAFVPQELFIPFSFSVLEIALLGRCPYLGRFQEPAKNDLEIVDQALRLTDSREFIDRFFDELSSGERQRVIIAKALAQEPTILLMDEPTSHLDITHQIKILDIVKKLNIERNLTVMIVLHDLNLASEYCGRIILLNEGRLHKIGTPQEILNYKTIEDVYKTVVLVNQNPLSKKPFVSLVPQLKDNK